VGAVDWNQLLEDARASPPPVTIAQTFVKKWPTSSLPVLLECTDGEYVVKGVQTGRIGVNDQVVARIGLLAGSPVGEPMLVDVPQSLIDREPEMSHMTAGVSHGTAHLLDCSDAKSYEHTSEAANKPRFSSLALLFGWIQAGDHQFIYENMAPNLVHSVDHGHFFPNGPNWDSASLQAAADPAPDAGVMAGAGLVAADIASAKTSFQHASNEQIAAAVAAAQPGWGLAAGEDIDLARYLADRRDVLFA
jgi:hypothetical protein